MNRHSSRSRRTLRASTGVLALALLAVLAAPSVACAAGTASKAGPKKTDSYVALGDSYTAAPFVPNQVHQACARSDQNYPSLVAGKLKPKQFTDVSCSDATTVELTKPQLKNGSPINPPQFDALKRDTRLVTMGLGGNDAKFGEISRTCLGLGAKNPTGSPCKDHFTAGGTDQLAEFLKATAPKIGEALKGIHSRSPRAKVLVVGYPAILPEQGNGCFSPTLPLAAGDVPYLRDFVKSLNGMLAQQAKRNRAYFVDVYKPTIGHDVCQPTGTRWVEDTQPTSPAAPIHPNALGEAAMAKAVLDALGRR